MRLTHLAPHADAARVIVPVEALAEAIKGNEVRGAELEVFLRHEHLEQRWRRRARRLTAAAATGTTTCIPICTWFSDILDYMSNCK